jgi:hypothetical protein
MDWNPRLASRVALMLLVTALLFPPALRADLTVDCDADPENLPPGTYATLQEALDSDSLFEFGLHTIHVSGTCNESIIIRGHEFLIIQGPPGALAIIDGGTTAGPTVNIQRAREVTLLRLNIRNGNGGIGSFGSSYSLAASIIEGSSGACIQAGMDSRLELGNAPLGGVPTPVTLRNCGGPGLSLNRALAFVANAVIENNGTAPGGPLRPTGVVANTSSVQLNNVTVRGNSSVGLAVLNGAQAAIAGNTVIEDNGAYGVSVDTGSSLSLSGTGTIRNNGLAGGRFAGGVSAFHNSTIRGGGNITGNTGPGITLDSGSTMFVGSITVTGNSEEGIRLRNGAILEIFQAPEPPTPLRTFSGNGGQDITCDSSAILFGDTSQVSKTNCSAKKGK